MGEYWSTEDHFDCDDVVDDDVLRSVQKLLADEIDKQLSSALVPEDAARTLIVTPQTAPPEPQFFRGIKRIAAR